MNRIYKVIWSKVKNQYVVVSELAHSNGKQSRTGKKSLRSRIAALVVCGAIAAFGVYGTLPTQQVFAAANNQYIAIGYADYTAADNYDGEPYDPDKEYTKNFNGKTYIYTVGNDDKGYWVRKGYRIDIVEQKRPDTNAGYDTVINAYKDDSFEDGDDDGLIQSYQNVLETTGITTLNGEELNSTSTGMYGGAVNTDATNISSRQTFIIHDNNGAGDAIRVTSKDSDTFNKYFEAVGTEDNSQLKYNNRTGLYEFNGQVVSPENLYVINDQVGVFKNTDGSLYTGDVYGEHNEILMTGISEDNKYTTYWGSEIIDPMATVGNMPISTLQGKFDEVDASIRKIHSDDIKQVNIAQNQPGDDGITLDGGTINLQTIGKYSTVDENGDGIPDRDENGNLIYKADPNGGTNIPGGISVTSVKSPGEDTKIRFYNNLNPDGFTVDAGSRVVANDKPSEGSGSTEAQSLDSLSINGEYYTIPDTKLDVAASNTANVSANENKNENYVTTDEDGNVVTRYGRDYSVIDTAGNIVELKDIASATTLKDIDVKKIGDLQYNADGDTTNIVENNISITEAIGDLDNAVSKGWTATDGTNKISVTPKDEENTLEFNGDEKDGVTVTADTTNRTITVGLADVITVGTKTEDNSTHPVTIDGNEGIVSGLSNTTWTPDEVDYTISNKAATEAQLQTVATEASKHTTMTVNNEEMQAPSGENEGNYTGGNLQLKQTVTDGQIEYNVKLNDRIVLGDEPVEGTADKRVVLDGNTATVSIGGIDIKNVDGPYLAVGNGKLKFYEDGGLSTGNATGAEQGMFNVRPDGDLEITGQNSEFRVDAQTGNVSAQNSETKTIYKNGPREITTNKFNFDNGGSFETSKALDNTVDYGRGGNGPVTVTTDKAEFNENGATFTNSTTVQKYINGELIGELPEGSSSTNIKGGTITISSDAREDGKKIEINGTSGEMSGLSNITWNKDIAKEVAGSAELQSVAATQGQLQMMEANLSGDISDLDDLAVKYDSTDKNKVTLGGANEDGTPAREPVSLTNVANGAVNATSTDAVNGSQLYSVQQQAEAHNTVTNGKNIIIDEAENANGGTEYKVSLGDNIVLGKDTSSNAVSVEGDKGIITLTGTTADGTLNQIQLDAQQNSIFLGNGMTIDGQNGIVFGMSNTDWKADDEGSYKGYDGSSTAATEGQLYDVYNTAVKYDEGSNFGTITLQGSTYNYNAENPTASGGTSITNVAYATGNDGSAAVNVDYLKDSIDAAKTEVTNADQHINYDKDYSVDRDTHKVNLEVVDNKGNVVGNTSINDVASATDLGEISDLNSSIAYDSTGDGNVSIVDAVNNVDNKVGDLKYKHDDGSDLNYVTSGDSVTGAIGDLDAAIGDLSGQVTQAEKNHTTLTEGNGIKITDKGQKDENGNIAKHEYEVSLSNDITLGNVDKNVHLDGNNGNISATGNVSAGSFTSGNVTINKDGSNLVSGLSNTSWDWGKYDKGDYKGSSNAATEAQLSGAMDGVVQYDRVTDDKGNITIDKTNITLNKGGDSVTIHNVAGGKVEQGSTDAVNGDQLYQVQQGVVNNSSAINNVNNRVSSLSNRIDKVGAGAAALAALHPLDFDPDDKLSFAAGYGNYAGENAVAVGAFYQPNEDTMFSIGGTFGNDENMVNAGVSFKLGQKNNVSRSRVSMAKELVALRDEVAQLKALMAHSGVLPADGQIDTSALFPDVPENHWAYEYVHELAKLGIVEGYPDGNFDGDRMMTRYEFAAIVYRAMQKGVNVDRRMLTEFEPELKLIRVDVVAKDRNGNPTIERVRVNEEAAQQA